MDPLEKVVTSKEEQAGQCAEEAVIAFGRDLGGIKKESIIDRLGIVLEDW